MAKRAMQPAGFWSRHTVQVATRVLPGSTRDRYRQEFLAELYGLSRTRQLRHAFGVLSRSWALRTAINTPSQTPTADMEIVFPRRRRPLFCRLNLRHRWTTRRTEDGRPYLQCQRCGKDETDMFAGTRIDPRDVLNDVPPLQGIRVSDSSALVPASPGCAPYRSAESEGEARNAG